MSVQNFFTEEEKQKMTDAIIAAELNTSGEVRVHIEGRCKGNAMDSATNWFEKLEMQQTEQRNGVLFYMAVEDQKFAVYGDVGINAKVAENYWDEIREYMKSKINSGQFVDGLLEAILRAGEQLRHYFPYQSDDVNELSNEISFG